MKIINQLLKPLTCICLVVPALLVCPDGKADDSLPVFAAAWGSTGTNAGQFNGNYGIAVDGAGNVFVTDVGNHRVQKFDAWGNFIKEWGTRGTADGQFIGPVGIAINGTNVYVAEGDGGRIQRFDVNGNFISKWGSPGTNNGEFFNLLGIALDKTGSFIYVARRI